MVRFVDHVVRETERVGNAPRVCYRLGPATFVFGPGNTVMRPHFHRHSDDFVALFAQQITSNAGIDSAAHAQQNALFLSRTHARKIDESALSVNVMLHGQDLMPCASLQCHYTLHFPAHVRVIAQCEPPRQIGRTLNPDSLVGHDFNRSICAPKTMFLITAQVDFVIAPGDCERLG